MTPIVGYFNWRQTLNGGVTYEKVLKEHVDHWRASNKHYYDQVYKARLLATTELTAEQWILPLHELAKLFPDYNGVPDATQRSDEEEPST